ncbi:MAG: hypothetical protein AB1656_15870 [Candidatus Omnitrophota bacterium]
MGVKTECCYADCGDSDRLLERPDGVQAGNIMPCGCGKNRLVQWRESDGELLPAIPGQRFDAISGKRLGAETPRLAQFQGEARGGAGLWDSRPAMAPTADFVPSPFPAPNYPSYRINRVPSPIAAGGHLIHRSLTADRWYFWSLAMGNMELEIVGGEELGLSAAPIGDECGVAFLANAEQLHYYRLLPELDPNPEIVVLPSPACPNGAPLAAVRSQKSANEHEIQRIFIASEAGLLSIDGNQRTAPGLPARAEEWGRWQGDARGFWTPVFFANRNGNGRHAVIATHTGGWAYIYWLDENLNLAGEDRVRFAEGEGVRLLAPAVTADGLWLADLGQETPRIALIETSAELLQPPSWHKVPWLSQCFDDDWEAWAWTPIAAGKGIAKTKGLNSYFPVKVVYIGTTGMVIIDKNRLNLDRINVHSILKPVKYPQGFKTCPALVLAQGDKLFMTDAGTGRMAVYRMNGKRWIEYEVLNPSILRDLAGGPIWMGDDLIWPTYHGLHRLKI